MHSFNTRISRQKGFTLTEIAIVLGIIGLILGAIWVAASQVYNNQRVTKASNELLTITQAVRSLYATSSAVDTTGNADMVLSASDAGHYTYIQAGVFPSDMIITSGKAAVDPWNGGVAVSEATINSAGDGFYVYMDNVSQSGCIDMLTANTGAGRDNGLQAIGAGAGGAVPTVATTTFPVQASTAQGLCSNATNAIGFEFRLKG